MEIEAHVSPQGFNSDPRWLSRVRDGEREALQELLLRFQHKVYSVLVSLTGNSQEAGEATEQTFVRAFHTVSGYRDDQPLTVWLLRIAMSEGKECLRRRPDSVPFREPESKEELRPRRLQTWEKKPEELVSPAELRRLLEEKVLRLPVPYRTALVLRDVAKLPLEEAAAVLEVDSAVYRDWLMRGRLLLREELTPHFRQRRER